MEASRPADYHYCLVKFKRIHKHCAKRSSTSELRSQTTIFLRHDRIRCVHLAYISNTSCKVYMGRKGCKIVQDRNKKRTKKNRNPRVEKNICFKGQISRSTCRVA